MYRFSKRSKDNLSECHEDLQKIAQEAIKLIDFAVICGYRGEKEQNDAYEKKFSKLYYPLSKHNKKPSLAFDIIPYANNKFTGWNNHKAFYFLAGHIRAVAWILLYKGEVTHRIRWGGDWDSDVDLTDQVFIDLPHFELIET